MIAMPISRGPAGPVHWREIGTGPPLVLIHGLVGNLNFWVREMRVWAPRFRMLVVDLRGSGRTPSSPAPFTVADLADDVVAVLDDAGVARANILGFSTGGNIALALALARPDRVERLVLVSTFACMDVQSELFHDAVLAGYEATGDQRQTYRVVYPWLFSRRFLSDPANSAFRPEIESDPSDQSMADWRALYLAQRRFDVRRRLPEIRARTLVVAGGQDRLVSLAQARELARGIPRARLTVIRRAGHLVNVEVPRTFHRRVTRFV